MNRLTDFGRHLLTATGAVALRLSSLLAATRTHNSEMDEKAFASMEKGYDFRWFYMNLSTNAERRVLATLRYALRANQLYRFATAPLDSLGECTDPIREPPPTVRLAIYVVTSVQSAIRTDGVQYVPPPWH